MDDIEALVVSWYSRPDMWEANSQTYPKSPGYIDCRLLDVQSMVVNKDVLNVGCCFPSDELQFSHDARKWVAIDFSSTIVSRCQATIQRPNLEFVHMNMRDLKFPSLSFDTVLDFSSGDHVCEEDYRATLTEIYRVLRPSGHFIVTYANLNVFKIKDNYGDFGYWRCASPEEMREMVEVAGFKVIREEDPTADRAGLVALK